MCGREYFLKFSIFTAECSCWLVGGRGSWHLLKGAGMLMHLQREELAPPVQKESWQPGGSLFLH